MSEYNEISPIVSFSCFHSFDLEWPRPVLKNFLLAHSIPYRNKLEYHCPGNTKGGSITVPLTSCLTGLESAV
jgi:hypothetical protein